MKAVPAHFLALGMAVLLSAGALVLLESQPKRAAAESLQVTAVAEQTTADQVELRVSWHWDPLTSERGGEMPEHLLAVSFDTQSLVFEQEEAPSGRGADGEMLQRLERFAGPDGSRRLFVVPQGADGSVRIHFRRTRSGLPLPTDPFRLFLVFGPPATEIWMTEADLSAPVTELVHASTGLLH